MKVFKTYKYQLRPSSEKETKFYQTVGVCRLIYNLSLELRQTLYKDFGLSIGKTELQKQVKDLANEYDWIQSVHSPVRQNAIHRLIQTYDNFFQRGMGFPKFAKKDFYNSFTYPQGVKIKTNYIYLPKMGWVKCYKNQNLPQDAVIKTTTVSKEADAWHVSVTFETEQTGIYPFHENQAVGIDVGVQYYYVSSDGEFAENPSFLKEFAAKIKKLNRKLARQKKGSHRRKKTKATLPRFIKN